MNGRLFQYRKRYGLHAMEDFLGMNDEQEMFQYRKRYGLHAMMTASVGPRSDVTVSIPQAVWIACNKEEIYHEEDH